MAVKVLLLRPAAPIMAIYAHGILSVFAEPQGAAAIVPMLECLLAAEG